MTLLCNCLSLCLFFVSVLGRNFTVLTNDSGAICRRVQAKPNNDGSYVKLLVNEIIADYKIPGLIFNYDDIVNFASVPIFENFTNLYPQNKTELYLKMLNDEGQFITDTVEGHSLDSLNFWSGIIDKEIIFPVVDSGMYCVYIAPDPVNVPNFVLPVHFKKYYGNLNYAGYLYYNSLKWLLVLLVGIFAALMKLTKTKDAKGSQNLSSVKAITNTVVLLTLIPFTVEYTIYFIQLYLQNYLIEPYKSVSIMAISPFILELAANIHQAVDQYVALLFAMGLGVVYYYNDDSQSYRKFPRDLFLKTTVLFAVKLSIMIIGMICIQSPGTIPLVWTTIATESFANILNGVNFLLDFIWILLSIVFYFKTKKRLTAIPPNPDIGSSDKVVSAFKKSTLVIWIMPLLIHGLGAAVGGSWLISNIFKELDHMPTQSADTQARYESILLMQTVERAQFINVQFTHWSGWLNTFLTIGLVVLIWVRSSNKAALDEKNK